MKIFESRLDQASRRESHSMQHLSPESRNGEMEEERSAVARDKGITERNGPRKRSREGGEAKPIVVVVVVVVVRGHRSGSTLALHARRFSPPPAAGGATRLSFPLFPRGYFSTTSARTESQVHQVRPRPLHTRAHHKDWPRDNVFGEQQNRATT